MRETRFKQVLHWSEFGKLLFIGQSIFIISITYAPLIQMGLEGRLQLWMEENNTFPYPSYVGSHPSNIAFVTASIFIPLFLAWLTQWKLVKPLRKEEVPSQKWFNLLFVMGLAFVISIELYIIGKPLIEGSDHLTVFIYYLPAMLLSTISVTTLIFSSLIVGTLCVAVARHKSKKLVRDFPNTKN